MNTFWIMIATFFHVGHLPIAPGTWASLITTGVVYAMAPQLASPLTLWVALMVVVIAGIFAGSYLEKHLKKKDPGACVIDEVAGQMLCLIGLPHSIPLYVAGFLLFRIFDILKPFPIRRFERIGGGAGVMADDLVAGLYTLLVLRVTIWIDIF